MKTRSIIIVALIAFTGMAFKSKPLEYKVDNQKSKLTWIGKKVTGEHTGNISLADGKLISDGKQLIGGSFEIEIEPELRKLLDETKDFLERYNIIIYY